MNSSSEGTVMAENESIGVMVALFKVGVCGSSLLILLYSQWNGKQEEGIEDAVNLKKNTHLGKVQK